MKLTSILVFIAACISGGTSVPFYPNMTNVLPPRNGSSIGPARIPPFRNQTYFNDLARQVDDLVKDPRALNKTALHDAVDKLTDVLDDSNLTKQFYPKLQSVLRAMGASEARNRSQPFRQETNRFSLLSEVMPPQRRYNVSFNNITVHVPAASFQNKTISIIRWIENPYHARSIKRIFSKVVSITLSDSVTNAETNVSNLNELINITLPITDFNFYTANPQCVYWDETANEWLSNGCSVSDYTPENVTCGCNHLTDFSVTETPNSNQILDTNDSSSSTVIPEWVAGVLGAVGGVIGFAFVGTVSYRLAKDRYRKQTATTHGV